MRLSRAILVMLLLHFLAVGGFLASSMVRERGTKRPLGDSASALEAEDSNVPVKGDGSASKKVLTTPNTRPSVHVVRPGETLTLIANENGVTLEALVAANGAETVTNGLKAGQELRLPDKSPEPSNVSADVTSVALSQIEGRAKAAATPSMTNPSTSTRAKAPTVPDSGKTYVVAKGENAVGIAQKNKVSYDALLRLNQIDDPKKLRPGQKLHLPVSVASKVKTKQS